MYKKIAVYCDDFSKVKDLFPDHLREYIFQWQGGLIPSVDNEDTIFSMLIIDADKIISSKDETFKNIKINRIFQDLPIVAYLENDSFRIKSQLFSLGIKGIINSKVNKLSMFKYIEKILLNSNYDIGSTRDRFIKSLISYENLNDDIEMSIYLANYMIHEYNINIFDATYIRDIVSLLMVAYTKNNLYSLMKIMENMEIVLNLQKFVNNYEKKQGIKNSIILSTLILSSKNFSIDIEALVNQNNLDSNVYELAVNTQEHSRILIDSYDDINNYWNILAEKIFDDKRFDENSIDTFLNHIFMLLNTVLIDSGALCACIDTNAQDDYMIVRLEPFNCKVDFVDKCMDKLMINSNDIIIDYEEKDDGFIRIIIKYYTNKLEKQQEKVSLIQSESKMIQHKLVSAKEYCKNTDVDNELLEDIDEIAEYSLDVLSMNEYLTKKSIDEVIKSLEKFISLFTRSYEFKTMTDGFIELKIALETKFLETMDKSLQVSVNHCLSSVIEDLVKWKGHIFTKQDAPDIHYMDDSMINNCVAVACMINPIQIDDSEDDLEFF